MSFTYSCPCANGACTTAPTESCTDSDGGSVPGVRGTVTIQDGRTWTDVCEGDSRLLEHTCYGTGPGGIQYPCHCVDGACVETAFIGHRFLASIGSVALLEKFIPEILAIMVTGIIGGLVYRRRWAK